MPQQPMVLYPFKFDPIYKEKVWGGRSLEKLGRALPGPPDTPIGESWELADLGATSPGGGGGGEARSKLANGLFAGHALHDILPRLHQTIMGPVPLNEGDAFPLLIKFLDARQNLSVQVHPSEPYASEHPEAHLKSEAWYIVDADPGAAIYKGVREGVTPDLFRRAIENGTVEDLLIRCEVRPGDCHYLPSGTCHALGAGVLVAEVQTPSDTTFRVYDWGRTGRELHVEQALACIRYHPARTADHEPHTRIDNKRGTVETLVRCEHFRIEKITRRAATAPDGEPIVTNDQPRIRMVLAGSGLITCTGGGGDQTPFTRGETLLLPAAMDRPRLHLDGEATWLEVTFPQATADLLA